MMFQIVLLGIVIERTSGCMTIELYDHQKEALTKIKTGSILRGGVGSGKSLTALEYYYRTECGAKTITGISGMDEIVMSRKKDLYIITTARKRDTFEWDGECANYMLSRDSDVSLFGIKVVIDSWNNISKYVDVENAFFIFDEQRLVGSGTWVKSFIKITKTNNWIMLSATPGDTWMDYVPVFIANGFFKNRTEFIRRHVVYSNFTKYPKIDRYVETSVLMRYRQSITVGMNYVRPTMSRNEVITVDYDKEMYDMVNKKRWNVFEDKPIKDVGNLCYTLRKVINSDPNRMQAVSELIEKNKKLIIFYNFNYELDILRSITKQFKRQTTEWNGHKHEVIPTADTWIYLVQYTAGAEGWNCITTNTILFYSQNYSHKIMVQAAGRIDRLNTPFKDLYYYHIRSKSPIDMAIYSALGKKKNFHEKGFVSF